MSEILKRRTITVGSPDSLDDSISELYHENTKLRNILGASGAFVPGGYSVEEMNTMARAYKRYGWHDHIPLPGPDEFPPSTRTFDEVIASRRSRRNFGSTPLPLAEFAKILYQTYGLTGEAPLPGGGRQPFRAVPSAGALYPGELYLGVRHVEGLAPGIYHYQSQDHALVCLRPGDPTNDLHAVCCFQEYARQASVVFLISGVLQRTKRKYGERGYRYVFLDIGHLGQNLYLACNALGLAVSTTGGFFDDEANRLLDLDGIEESVLYVAFVGTQEESSGPVTWTGGVGEITHG